ncbi:hypothetical protein AA103196_1358 [Ameyamaea chiangmaiensis NBRC 103196]|nr:hypothetical protein AA103196_1358 [Ameyamaea chiangmaiensis NBRC 103196]
MLLVDDVAEEAALWAAVWAEDKREAELTAVVMTGFHVHIRAPAQDAYRTKPTPRP